MLDLSPELEQLLAGPYKKAGLVQIEFEDVTVHLTDAAHDIEYGGVVYRSGFLSKLPNFNTNGEVKVGDVSFTLNTANNALTAIGFQRKWINRPITFSRAYFKNDMTLVAVLVRWRGLLSDKDGQETTSKGIQNLKAASVWADFEARRGRRTNHQSQQIHHPGDRGFEFSGRVVSNLDWGQKNKSEQGGSSRNGGSQPKPNAPSLR